MNKTYVHNTIKIGDVVRITTKEAIGVIGRVISIDTMNDGIELAGLKNSEELEQIDNAVAFETAIFPITDILYIFKIKLEQITKNNGTNDSTSKV